MNPNDPLAQLRDLSLPEQPMFVWWPPAIGWWVLLVLLIAAVYFLSRTVRRLRADNWYRQALRELEVLSWLGQAGDLDQQEVLIRCSRLCRRVAMVLEGREAIAGLTGEAWRAKLDQLSGSHDFSSGSGALLDERLWQKPDDSGEADINATLNAVARLIKNNKPGVTGRRRG